MNQSSTVSIQSPVFEKHRRKALLSERDWTRKNRASKAWLFDLLCRGLSRQPHLAATDCTECYGLTYSSVGAL